MSGTYCGIRDSIFDDEGNPSLLEEEEDDEDDKDDKDDKEKRETFKKDQVDEIMEDEFNINSTVGLVSALLLSCLSSGLMDAHELKQYEDAENEVWHSASFSRYDAYQIAMYVTLACDSAFGSVFFNQHISHVFMYARRSHMIVASP